MERIKIDQERNKIELSFNENFYSKEFIDRAILDFKEVCDINQNNGKIILNPKEKTNVELLGYEFYNYVLMLMKNL